MPKKRSVHFTDEALSSAKIIADERGYTFNQAVNVGLINFGKYIKYRVELKKFIDKLFNPLGFAVTPYYPEDELKIISTLGKKMSGLKKPEKLDKYEKKVTPKNQK